MDIHSETDSAREFSSGLKSENDDGHKHSYHNTNVDLGGHMRHFQGSSGGKTSAKTASQPHLPHASASYNSADSDLGKAGKCLDCQFVGHSLQPPSRRAPPAQPQPPCCQPGNGEGIDRSRLHVRGGSRCSAQSSIDTDQGSVSTTGRESTTANDEEEELEEEEEEEEDFEGSVEVPESASLPPPPPPPLLQTSELGTTRSRRDKTSATT